MLASKLSGTEVMSTDGQHVGSVHNLTMDPKSGDLSSLVVETERTEIFGIEQDDEGLIHLPAEVIEAVRDHLIVTPPTTVAHE